MAELPLHQRVYIEGIHCSCRACGLVWHAHSLQPCPRCNEASLHSEAVKLQEKVEEYDQSFALYDNAVRRGTKHWQNAPGNPHKVWPDTAKLVNWMADEIDDLTAALAQQEKKTHDREAAMLESGLDFGLPWEDNDEEDAAGEDDSRGEPEIVDRGIAENPE